MTEPRECCLEFGNDLNREINRQDMLIRRAAELLRHVHVVFPNWQRSDVEEWLQDAGMEK